MSKIVEVVLVEMTPNENRGEAVDFSAEIHDQGDDENNIWTHCAITLYSQGCSATISMGTINPQIFRDIADKLDEAITKYKRPKMSMPIPPVGTGKSGKMSC